MKSLFGAHMAVTGKVMDMQLLRQNVVTSNLANLTTPGYTARRVEFEKDLQAALEISEKGKMAKTEPGHIPATFDADVFGPDMEKGLKHRVIHGEDNVDLDKEMAVMAKNQLRYTALATVLKRNFDGMTQILADGGR
jgi:flagellar basal-body rod protein FlgB